MHTEYVLPAPPVGVALGVVLAAVRAGGVRAGNSKMLVLTIRDFASADRSNAGTGPLLTLFRLLGGEGNVTERGIRVGWAPNVGTTHRSSSIGYRRSMYERKRVGENGLRRCRTVQGQDQLSRSTPHTLASFGNF